jgi:23S rRNA-/tRNA-specific pseudouridylate synthase
MIIHKHPHFIIVNKPSGISTHASPGDTAPNVVDLLKADYPVLQPLTRLDNGASGLLLLSLNNQFTKYVKFISKSYLANVFGCPKPKQGFIDKPLLTKKFGSGTKRTQEAYSHYRVLKKDAETACVLIRIETGRHHQIRRHLRNIGAPIVGDFRHGHKEKNLIHQEKTGKKLRLMLQCYRLVFSHQGKIYRFKLPSEL